MKSNNINKLMCVLLIILLAIVVIKCFIMNKSKETFSFKYEEKELSDFEAACYLKNYMPNWDKTQSKSYNTYEDLSLFLTSANKTDGLRGKKYYWPWSTKSDAQGGEHGFWNKQGNTFNKGRLLLEKAKHHWKHYGSKNLKIVQAYLQDRSKDKTNPINSRHSPFVCLTDYEAQCYLDNNPKLADSFGLKEEDGKYINNNILDPTSFWTEKKDNEKKDISNYGNLKPLEKAKKHWIDYGNKKYKGTKKDVGSPFTCDGGDINREKYYVYHINHCEAGGVKAFNWPNRPDWCCSERLADNKCSPGKEDVSKLTKEEFNSKFVNKGQLGSSGMMKFKDAQFNEIVSIGGQPGRWIKDNYTIKQRDFLDQKNKINEFITNLDKKVNISDFEQKMDRDVLINNYLSKDELNTILNTKIRIPLGDQDITKALNICYDDNDKEVDCPWKNY